MSTGAFMCLGKLKGPRAALDPARHNLREFTAATDGHIDPCRSGLNYVLRGPANAKEVAQLAMKRISDVGIDPRRLRKDAVLVVEALFSLQPRSQVAHRPYFEDCAAWAGARFGGNVNIISAAVHLDEEAPHLHVLLVPALDGRMVGSDMVGGKKELAAHHKSFHENVASKYGFEQPKKTSPSQNKLTAKTVIQRLRDTADPALKSVLWAAIRDSIEAAPASFADALGICEVAPGKPKLRTLTQVMTSPGKGPKREPHHSNPIRLPSEPYRTAAANPILCRVRA